MAAKKESKSHEEDERKIPVFTVLKNGAILKNIFILNKPPPPAPPSPPPISQNPDQDYKEILTVGRHPDCNITLTHPSISRFHLQIRSNPYKKTLSVMDLSSVHGTWVSDKRVEPGEWVELKEGDTLRVGGSSRVYRLHWVPLSRAYDLENPFVPPALDAGMTEEKEEENAVETYQDEKPSSIGNESNEEKDSSVAEEKEEEKYQDKNSFSIEKIEIQSLDPILEDVDSLFSWENLELIGKKEIPSAPPLPEYMICDEKEVDENPSRIVHEPREILSLWSGPFGPGTELGNLSLPIGGVILGTENQQLEKENESPKPHSVMDVLSEKENVESCSSRSSGQEFKLSINIDSSVFVQEEEVTYPVAEIPEQTESSILLGKDHDQMDASRLCSGHLMMENSSLEVEKFPTETNKQQADEEINLLGSPDSACCDEEGHSVPGLLEETERQSVLSKEHEVRKISSLHSVPIVTEYMDSSLVAEEVLVTVLSEITEKEESRNWQSVFAAAGLSQTENSILLGKDHSQMDASRLCSGHLMMENSSLKVEKFPTESNKQQADEEKQTPRPLLALQSLTDRGKEENLTAEQEINLLVSPDSACCDEEGHSVPELLEETECQSVLSKDHEVREISSLHSVPIVTEYMDSSLVAGEVLVTVLSEITEKEESRNCQSVFAAAGLSQIELSESSSLGSEKQLKSFSIWSRRGKPASVPQIQTGESRGKIISAGIDAEVESDSQEDMEKKSISRVLFTGLHEEEEIFTPNKENIISAGIDAEVESDSQEDMEKKSISRVLFTGLHEEEEIFTPNKENIISAGIDAEVESESQEDMEKKSISRVLFTGLHEEEEIFTLNKENFTPNKENIIGAGIDAEVESESQEDMEKKSISRVLFTGLHQEEEIFTPNKENFTPNAILMNSLKKKGRIGETKHSKSCRSSSSNVTFSPGMDPEQDMTASLDNENKTLKIHQERVSARPTSGNRVRLEQEIVPIKRISKRVPFQSLLVDSTGKSRSDTSVPEAAMRSCNFVTHTQTKEVTNICSNNITGEAKRSWTMVVDTTTLLNKESRKSLHLLRGLKGTHLIIPRMVIRELDCLKRRGSLFRRTTEASSVLEWIEECMVKTTWWIHVQSSFEEGGMTAPTPPASPQSGYSDNSLWFSCGTASSMPFSSHGSLSEIVSPTAEDHILNYALLYRKKKTNGRLVLLSDDVTMKIKAMAEGLICETAHEFRESLVNPFSERFLWADSSPRGLTWSYSDDVVLREQYCRCPLKKPAKGGSVKGLKLILLHNFHYGRISSAT